MEAGFTFETSVCCNDNCFIKQGLPCEYQTKRFTTVCFAKKERWIFYTKTNGEVQVAMVIVVVRVWTDENWGKDHTFTTTHRLVRRSLLFLFLAICSNLLASQVQ